MTSEEKVVCCAVLCCAVLYCMSECLRYLHPLRIEPPS
jgi:hypothetical protein